MREPRRTDSEESLPEEVTGVPRTLPALEHYKSGQAKERGLVDEFGGLDKAIEVAKELAKIPADKGVERVILPYPRTFLQELLSTTDDNPNTQLAQQRAIYAALPEDARRAFRYMQLMDRMKNGETMLVMPFDIRIK